MTQQTALFTMAQVGQTAGPQVCNPQHAALVEAGKTSKTVLTPTRRGLQIRAPGAPFPLVGFRFPIHFPAKHAERRIEGLCLSRRSACPSSAT